MTADAIDRIRDFNRFYTQRIGLLTDHYLGQDRPLGPSRLLWEIGEHQRTGRPSETGERAEIRGRVPVRELRARLGLDSGYLSRLLRSLEEQGLVRVVPDASDARVRVAELTAVGVREREALDARSRAGVAALVGALTPGQRDELVAAQEKVRRLLRLAAVTITPVAAGDRRGRECLRAYADELAARFPEGYDDAALTPPPELDGSLLLALEEDGPAGCGAWVWLEPGVAEIRHLWVAPHARGISLGRRLLGALEADAARRGAGVVRLGTHRVLDEARSLYLSSGYREIAGYGSSPYNQLCFEKPLNVTLSE